MRRAIRPAVNRVVTSLLMLATLLVYAAPGHANLMSSRHAAAPYENTLADTHEQAPCTDPGLLEEWACCSVAQCVAMHGGLPAVVAGAFLPRLSTSIHLPALATPEGIGTDPALRPPL